MIKDILFSISPLDKNRLIEKVSLLPVDLIAEIDYVLKLILNLH